MKWFTRLLLLTGICLTIMGTVNLFVPLKLSALVAKLTSWGGLNPALVYAFKGTSSGLFFGGITVIILAVLFYLAEKGVIGYNRWQVGKFLAVVLGIKILLCAIFLVCSPYQPDIGDESEFHYYAQCLATGQPILEGTGHLTAWRSIGWPAFLSVFYRIFGPSYLVAQILNVLSVAAISLLTYLLGRRLFDEKTARGATLILTVMPSQIIPVISLFADVFTSFLILLTVFLAQRRATLLNGVLLGFSFGAALATRSLVFFLPIIFAAYTFAAQKSWKATLNRLLLIALCGELVLLPWQIRNYHAFGMFVPVSTMGGMHFWTGNNAKTNGGMTIVGFPPKEEQEWLNAHNEAERDRYAYQKGLAYLTSHPWQTMKLWPKKLFLMLAKDSRSVSLAFGLACFRINPAVYMTMLVGTEGYYFALFIAFLLSAGSLLKRERLSPRIWLLGGTVLYFCAIHAVYIAEGRYHMPLVPIFALLAAVSKDILKAKHP